MIVIPKDIPLITDLNSYYLNIEKLFEHYQGIVDGGCIYFKSPATEGVVFFDNENLINGIMTGKNMFIKGIEAIDHLLDESGSKNYSISIYEISPERITYWANVFDSEDLYKDLSTEFTDLEGLVKKMMSEKLTGYIEILFGDTDKASVFLLNGEWLGSASSDSKWKLSNSETDQDTLIKKSRGTKALLHVKKIPLNQIISDYTLHHIKQKQIKSMPVQSVNSPKIPIDEVKPIRPLNHLEMLQHLMIIFEKFIVGNKKIKDDFDTILKRKFMEKIDIYEFLDPFAAEFKYSNGKIIFTGKADNITLSNGLIECLYEIANENNMQGWIKKHIGPWQEKYSRELESVKLNF